jgi:hypothetical protein
LTAVLSKIESATGIKDAKAKAGLGVFEATYDGKVIKRYGADAVQDVSLCFTTNGDPGQRRRFA